MLILGQCMFVAGLAGLGYEAALWAWSGSWLPMTVDDIYRAVGVYDLVENSDQLRAAASWYLDTPLALLAALYGIGLTLYGRWRYRRRAVAR